MGIMFMLFGVVFLVILFGMTLFVASRTSGGQQDKLIRKRGIKGKLGRYNADLYSHKRGIRVELFAHSGQFTYLSEAEDYKEAVRAAVIAYEAEMIAAKERAEAESKRQFDVEAWDGDVYEEEVTEVPKKKADATDVSDSRENKAAGVADTETSNDKDTDTDQKAAQG
ncbi:hypothetical protein FLK61_25005 [Paenalkalicoccus suaedae]|uniref:Uncharacterized protein n=1 Tax=Paenalkalicoccus suaedae TaxID=2592382 RepID=A0A859FCP7_9BACI|nr:hypothetical protein [Paenalkalicoccus suaedae]QKS70035.1 hypothetical protein FLK61_25005 [Paenalkalicoccus suaedae]